jgi:hypothetical protein
MFKTVAFFLTATLLPGSPMLVQKFVETSAEGSADVPAGDSSVSTSAPEPCTRCWRSCGCFCWRLQCTDFCSNLTPVAAVVVPSSCCSQISLPRTFVLFLLTRVVHTYTTFVSVCVFVIIIQWLRFPTITHRQQRLETRELFLRFAVHLSTALWQSKGTQDCQYSELRPSTW